MNVPSLIFKKVLLLFCLWQIGYPLLTAQQYTYTIKKYSTEDGLSQRDARSLCQDKKGFIWIGTSHGLNRFDGYTFKVWTKTDDGLLFDQIDRILEAPDGNMILDCTPDLRVYKGRCVLNPATNKVVNYANFWDDAYTMYHFRQDTIPLCNGKLLAIQTQIVEKQTGQLILNIREAIGDADIYCTMLDKAGALWVGYTFGLVKIEIHEQLFHRYMYTPDKPIGHSIRGMMETPSGKVLVNTEGHGQWLLDPVTQTDTRMNDAALFYDCIMKDDKGAIYTLSDSGWAATKNAHHSELYRFNKDRLERVTKANDPSGIWCAYYEGDSKFLICNQNDGLCEMDVRTGDKHVYAKKNGYNEITANSSLIYDIRRDNQGQVWLCSTSGFYQWDPQKGITARYWSGGKGSYHLPTDAFLFYYQDKAGIYWLASKDVGLVRWDRKNNQSKFFSRKAGLPCETIYAVYEDKHQHLWLPSDQGIIQFDKTKGEVRKVYTTSQGITHNEFNRIAHLCTSNGFLYLGGLNGITGFNPEDFYTQDSTHTVPLVIAECYRAKGLSGRVDTITTDVLNSMELRLGANDSYFEIDLTVLTYGDMSKVQYAYRYDGQEEWTFQSIRRFHSGGLGYGRHVLHLRAQTEEGLWSSEVDITIYQLRPFYLQAWFLLLMALLLATGIWFFIRNRTRKLLATQIQLENTVNERTEQLKKSLSEKDLLIKEIHHRVKNNLQIISSLLSLQSSKTDDEITKSALAEGQNRVQSIALIHHKLYQQDRFDSVELGVFVKDLYAQIAALFSNKQIKISDDIRIDKLSIDLDTAVPLGLIMNELLTNSYKYAFKSGEDNSFSVRVEKQDSGGYKLVYKDSGPGLPADFNLTKAKSLGMRLITQLSKQIGGKTEYHYENGSIFEIYFRNTDLQNS